jgi:carbonic anhydrase/acetyltransferase-like protein (isoleucine patch superfamily)
MIHSFKDQKPTIHESCFIAESADIIGQVTIGENSNIWYNAVLRGDYNYIKVGKNTNIQDNSSVHISEVYPVIIGDHVTIGHSAIIHACKIGNNTLIGMGAIILDGAEIGEESIIGAGSLVSQGKVIPSGVLALGSPAKVVRELSLEERKGLKKWAEDYVGYAKEYKK